MLHSLDEITFEQCDPILTRSTDASEHRRSIFVMLVEWRFTAELHDGRLDRHCDRPRPALFVARILMVIG